MERVVCAEEGAESSSGVVGLGPAFWCEFYAVVGDGLVDISVFLGEELIKAVEGQLAPVRS